MYNIGDIIKLKNYDKPPRHIVPQMLEYLGMTMVIKEKSKVEKCYVYALEECSNSVGGWWWKEKDFKNINDMNKFESEDFEL